MDQTSTFIIVRDDLDLDPARIITEGLLIGRYPLCELLLNHPTVSRMQAGIKQAGGRFYIYNLRPTNPFLLNGRTVEESAALAPGDLLEIGPFILHVEGAEQTSLMLTVSRRIGTEAEPEEQQEPVNQSAETRRLPDLQETLRGKQARTSQTGTASVTSSAHMAALDSTKPLDIFWSNRIDDAHKLVRPSPLFPHSRRNPPKKTRYDWHFTTDLARRYPLRAIMLTALVAILLSISAAFWFANAYAPAQVSNAHARNSILFQPAVASRPNANSCTTCHILRGQMETSCASCHQTEAFSATVIPEHKAAGIGCTSCHAEHKGAEFEPARAALLACAECHNDGNHQLYNGRAVHTPHGGTFGYPVTAGNWTWKGLSEEEWPLKGISLKRSPTDTDDQWRSKQFHALHLYRVKAAPGMPANKEGEMSCSSCHQSFNPIDRLTPRTTCAACHNGKQEEEGRYLIARDAPNCTSCHIQHVRDEGRWNSSLLGHWSK